jgi:hypothetical protein
MTTRLKYSIAALLSIALGAVLGPLLPKPSSAGPSTPKQSTARSQPLGGRGQRETTLTGLTTALETVADAEGWKGVLTSWTQKDPEGVLEWLLAHEPKPSGEVLEHFFRDWAASQPEAACSALINLPARMQREEIIGAVLNQLLTTREGLEFYCRWAPLMEYQLRGCCWSHAPWIKDDPAGLIQQFKTLPNGVFTSFFTSGVIKNLIAKDPHAATALCQQMEGLSRMNAFAEIVEARGKNEARTVLDEIARSNDPNERWSAFEVLDVVAQSDPRAAYDWVAEHGSFSDDNAGRRIMKAWVKKDQAEALQYATTLDDPASRQAVLSSFLDAIQNQKNGAAASFEILRSLPSNREASRLSGGLDISRDAYLQWLETLPPDDLSASAAMKFTPHPPRSAVADRSAPSTAQDALYWSLKFPDAIREAAVLTTLEQWKKTDAPAAAQAAAGLPEGPLKERALTRIR